MKDFFEKYLPPNALFFLAISMAPLMMMGLEWWSALVLGAASSELPIMIPAYWIIGLIWAIRREQDYLSILYYVLFAFCIVFVFLIFIGKIKLKSTWGDDDETT